MCLVKVKGEVDDEVVVPARRVAERDVTETTIVETRTPIVISETNRQQRSHASRSRRASSSSSSSSSSSAASSSSPPRSVRSALSKKSNRSTHSRRDEGYAGSTSMTAAEKYKQRVLSDGKPRQQYRYVDPNSAGGGGSVSGGGGGGGGQEVRREISKAEEHLKRAAELEERERRYGGSVSGRSERKSIQYNDPRGSQTSYRSYGGNQGRRSEVVIVQEDSRTRERY